MTDQKIKSALESLLFVWGEPLEAKAAAELFDITPAEMLRIMRELKAEYDERGGGIRIAEADKAFRLCTDPENDDYITRFVTPVREKRLSQAALEVLAVIAYKQPVTKSEIDQIRGIRSDRVLEGLTRRGLVEERGRSAAIGRPILYGTTRQFLELFGFESLDGLPEIEDAEILAGDGQLTMPAGAEQLELGSGTDV
ncbi:MAG: SMC-Scp complex subunit ScpB [Firmicutes bacterium]|nr:SMC-Scp complex subunit ScpB [Bacillota bacterium]MBQ2059366.1 SMC-Scp complex subunit ScpB [Bacillota bacterium]